jgi:hypothetical protein
LILFDAQIFEVTVRYGADRPPQALSIVREENDAFIVGKDLTVSRSVTLMGASSGAKVKKPQQLAGVKGTKDLSLISTD